jgi:hypothetical protein
MPADAQQGLEPGDGDAALGAQPPVEERLRRVTASTSHAVGVDGTVVADGCGAFDDRELRGHDRQSTDISFAASIFDIANIFRKVSLSSQQVTRKGVLT